MFGHNNDETISILFVLRNEIFIRKFRNFYQILCLFRAGLVYTRPPLFWNNRLFSECSFYFFFKLNRLCDCTWYSWLPDPSSQSQIYENAIEIILNLKRRFHWKTQSTWSSLDPIKITYLTGRTNKSQRIRLPSRCGFGLYPLISWKQWYSR